MSGYRAILSARFRTLLQYRAAALAGFACQLVWGLIFNMVYEAFYRATSRSQPMSLPEVISYTWLGQAMFALLPWNVDADVRGMIRTGSMAYELLRPLDLYTLWYTRSLAARVAPTLLRALPMFVVAGLFFGLRPPPSLASGLAWFAATCGAVLLSSAISTLLTVSLLWTLSGEGITRLMPALVIMFSGMLIPLPLYPDWAQALLAFLPFRGLVDAPFRLYMGHIPAGQVGFVLAHQLLWTGALILLGRILLARGTRRLVIQGG